MSKWKTAVSVATSAILLLTASVGALVGAAPAAANKYVEVKVEVPEGASGTCVYYYNAFAGSEQFDLNAGDKLEYDVEISHDVAGFGGMDMLNTHGVTIRDYPGGPVDDQNVRFHPSADLSDHAFGKTYHRSVTIPYGGDMVNDTEHVHPRDLLLCMELDLGSLGGQTVIAKYDNIKITRGGETVYTFFANDESFRADAGASADDRHDATVTVSIKEEESQPTDPEDPVDPVDPAEDEPIAPITPDAPQARSMASPAAPDGEVLKFAVKVGQDATGLLVDYQLVANIGYTPKKGDFLEYDITVSHKGLGMAVDLMAGDNGTVRDWGGLYDENFVSPHPKTDISGWAYQYWYHRKINMPEHWGNPAQGVDKIAVAVELEVADASKYQGETLTAWIDNIRIVNDGEVRYTIFTSSEDNMLMTSPVDYNKIGQIAGDRIAIVDMMNSGVAAPTDDSGEDPEGPTDPEDPDEPKDPDDNGKDPSDGGKDPDDSGKDPDDSGKDPKDPTDPKDPADDDNTVSPVTGDAGMAMAAVPALAAAAAALPVLWRKKTRR